ncbi:hypothetical protein ACWGBX_38305 [Streptomyces sp. NPDC055037]
MTAENADGPAVHHDRETSVVVLEYVVHGRAVATGRPYHNHFVSVITLRDRKITHWRDHLDPLTVFDAIGAARQCRCAVPKPTPAPAPGPRRATPRPPAPAGQVQAD